MKKWWGKGGVGRKGLGGGRGWVGGGRCTPFEDVYTLSTGGNCESFERVIFWYLKLAPFQREDRLGGNLKLGAAQDTACCPCP